MTERILNPWKVVAIGMGLVMTTAVVTGVVVANWTGNAADRKVVEAPEPAAPSKAAPGKAAASKAAPQRLASTQRVAQAPARPSQSVIDECNRVAAQPSTKDKTVEVVKDAGVGALVGAAVGAAGGAIADGGKGAGKGAAIGGIVGAGAGTLYGLNENSKSSDRSREAYAACMRSKGF